MKLLKYSELNERQKDFISNGCGSKGGIIKIPNFRFKASCNQHDFYYWRGCSIEHRNKADVSFYNLMKEDIRETDLSWYKIAYYHTWAWSYYQAVSWFGGDFFNYDDNPKTAHDLNREMMQCKREIKEMQSQMQF